MSHMMPGFDLICVSRRASVAMVLPTKPVHSALRLPPSSIRKTAPLSPGLLPSIVVTFAAS